MSTASGAGASREGRSLPSALPCACRVREEWLWSELATWLRGHPRAWSSLEACGVEDPAGCLPGARMTDAAMQCLSVPESFEHYLASMNSKRRQEVRRKLSRTAEAGVVVGEVSTEQLPGAYADFLRMSELRREIRKNHDDTLIELLQEIRRCASIEVHVHEVLEHGSRIGVSVDLVHGGVYYPYVLAWEPDRSVLSPGILLALNAISDAIELGLGTVNLGPGAQDYKKLARVRCRHRFHAAGGQPGRGGRALRILGDAYQRVRPRPRAIAR